MPILDRLRGVANTAPPLLIVALYAVVSALWILSQKESKSKT